MNAAIAEGSCLMRVNNDGSNIYSRTQLSGNGSSASSGKTANDDAWFPIMGTTDFTSTTTVDLMNYSNTTTYKTTVARSNNPARIVDFYINMWRSTSAISTVAFTGNFATGSSFSLYGIKAA
jgi:hypothetical protein